MRWAAIRCAPRQLCARYVLAKDQCHLDLLPGMRATSSMRGQCRLVMTPGQNQRSSLRGRGSGKWEIVGQGSPPGQQRLGPALVGLPAGYLRECSSDRRGPG